MSNRRHVALENRENEMRVGRRALVPAAVVAALLVPAVAQAADPAPPAAPPAAAPPAGLHVAAFQAPSRVFLGDRVTLKGRVAPAAAVPVAVERLENGAWVTLMTIQSTAAGTFATTIPLPPGSVRVSVTGPDGVVSPSPRRSIAVVRRMTLAVTSQPLENIAGRPFRASGAAQGARAGERVALQGSRDGGRFTTIARLPVKGGRVDAAFTPPSGGTWRFRLAAAPTPGRDSGGEGRPTAATKVFGSNPHHVPASASHYLVQELSQFQLYYYENGKLRRVFPVVFGKPSTPTPVGRFAVYSKTAGPSAAFGPLVLWYHRGYGIHGTNQEYLLSRSWRYYSHGCTRNYNANIRWLWPRVPVGTPVVNLA